MFAICLTIPPYVNYIFSHKIYYHVEQIVCNGQYKKSRVKINCFLLDYLKIRML